MSGEHRPDGTAHRATEDNDAEEYPMGAQAKVLGSDGRNHGEETPVGKAVDHGEEVEHPQLLRHLKPQEGCDEQDKTDDHGAPVADAVNGYPDDKSPGHADAADGGEDARRRGRWYAHIGGVRYDMRHDDEQAEDDSEVS